MTLYANASRLYEPPTNFELEDDARSTGEPLDAMQGSVLEFGTRGSTTIGTRTRWSWDTSIYYARINDEILSVEDPFSPGTSLSANVDRTIHAGLEAVFDAEITMASGVLAPTLAFTYNHFKFDGDSVYGNSDLPAAPQYVLRGELIYQHSSGFYAGPTFDAVGHRWADFGNSYRIDSYQLLGLRAGYNQGNIRAFIEVQNLLEEDYVATPSVRNLAAADAAILNPGLPLSIFAGLTLSF